MSALILTYAKEAADFEVGFTQDGWFNATAVGKRYGKRPADWLRLPDTKRYIAALCRQSEVRKSHFTRAMRGKSARFEQGTWLHPKLAVPFARWLDIDFAVWCDQQIEQIVRGQYNSLWASRLALETKDACSKTRASIGSGFMLARKRELPSIKIERQRLDCRMQDGLFGAMATPLLGGQS